MDWVWQLSTEQNNNFHVSFHATFGKLSFLIKWELGQLNQITWTRIWESLMARSFWARLGNLVYSFPSLPLLYWVNFQKLNWVFVDLLTRKVAESHAECLEFVNRPNSTLNNSIDWHFEFAIFQLLYNIINLDEMSQTSDFFTFIEFFGGLLKQASECA